MEGSTGIGLGWRSWVGNGWTKSGVLTSKGYRSEVAGLDWACGWKMIWWSPGLEINVVPGIELGYSYELGSGWTRIGVSTRPRKGLGTVMTVCNHAGGVWNNGEGT